MTLESEVSTAHGRFMVTVRAVDLPTHAVMAERAADYRDMWMAIKRYAEGQLRSMASEEEHDGEKGVIASRRDDGDQRRSSVSGIAGRVLRTAAE